MADNRFALSNENIVKELKENAKNNNTSKATQAWLIIWQKWASERKYNTKLEEYEPKDIDEKVLLRNTYERWIRVQT